MLSEITQEADTRMGKSVDSLMKAFDRIRTGRANPSLLDDITISYYGTDTPLNQVGSITVEDARTLVVNPWEKHLIPDIEKAILKSDIGINPSTSGDLIRLPLPPLTEENRRDLAKHAKNDAENARIAIRNIRRDAVSQIRDLLKEKDIAEDEAHGAEEGVQKLTDRRIGEVDHALKHKEADLLEI